MNNSKDSKEKAGEIYDRWYEGNKAHWEEAPGKNVLIAALKACFPPESRLRLLDIGCGTGSFLARIYCEVSSHWELHGVDFSQVAIGHARHRHPNFHFVCDDATRLQYYDPGYFDIVTCYGSWEHFHEPRQAIAETSRVMAPLGWVFAMIPALGIHRNDRNDEGWYEDVEVAGCPERQLQWNFRRPTWVEMFERVGIYFFADSLAQSCGALKPGVFFFGLKLSNPV